MPRTYKFTRRDALALLIVVFVAALMRLGEPRAVEFFHDEAMLSLMAQELVNGENLPLTGIVSSAGLPNSPAPVYVMAIPYLLGDDVLLATLFVAALNVGGVAVLWWVARRYFGMRVALAASLAYALNPWAILYSRKIWAQDFHTPFFLLALALGIYGFGERKRWAQIACLPVLLFALQIHIAGWALLPLYALMVWQWRHNTSLKTLAFSLIAAALVMLPYGLGIVQTLMAAPDTLATVANRTSTSSGGLAITGDALNDVAMLATGIGVESWMAPQESTELLANVPPLASIWGILGVLVLFGLLAVWFSTRPLALLVTLWAVLPMLVFTPTWTKVYPHYFIASIPAFSLLAAIGLESLMGFFPKPLAARAVLMVAFAALVFTQGLWWRGALRYVERNPISLGEGTSGFTTPLSQLLPVRDAVRAVDDVIVLSDGQDPHFHADAARWPVMLRNSAGCVRALPPEGMILIPDGEFAAIIAPEAPTNSEAAAFYAENGQSVRFGARGDAEYRAVFVDSADMQPNITDLQHSQFSNGVIISGYALVGERVYLRWQLPQAVDRRFYAARSQDYQFFVHVLDADGNRIFQQDAQFLLGRHWCSGDTLITIHPAAGIETPPVTVRAGFYRLIDNGTPQPDIQPVDRLDELGNPAGQWIDIILP